MIQFDIETWNYPILNFWALISKLVSKIFFFKMHNVHMKEVIRGTGVAFTVKIFGAVLYFAFNVLLARIFGAEGAGSFFLVLTITTIGATVGRFGLENTLLRFIAVHAGRDDWSAVKGIYLKGMSIAFIISFLLSSLLFYIAPLLAVAVFEKPEITNQLRVMAFAVTPLVFLSLHVEALKALKRVCDSQLLQGVVIPAIFCVVLVGIGRRFGIDGAAYIYVFASFSAALLGIFIWFRHTPKLRKVTANFAIRRLLDSCVPLFWMQIMAMVINWASIFSLGVWGSKEDVGIFGVALRTAMLTSFILTSVNSVVAPKFSTLYSQGDMCELAMTARKSTLLMITFAAPILFLFLVAPNWVMGIFGNEFKTGGLLLSILAVGQFVNVATGSVGYLLMMTGNERLMRNNTLAAGVLTIILNLLLVPFWGPIGAALATTVSLSVMNISAFYLVWKKIGILTVPFLH